MRIQNKLLLIIYPLIFLSCTMKEMNQSNFDLVLKNSSYLKLGEKAKEYAIKFEWDNIIKEYLKIL